MTIGCREIMGHLVRGKTVLLMIRRKHVSGAFTENSSDGTGATIRMTSMVLLNYELMCSAAVIRMFPPLIILCCCWCLDKLKLYIQLL